jgi:UDP-N-acetylglucosamine 3-dehydrogenase
MIKTARKNNVQLMVGYIERFNPIIQKLKLMIERQEIGDIFSLDSKRLGIPRISDDGVILDLAIHDIDIMLYLLKKKVCSVYAVAQNVITPNKKLEDYANIILQFDKGTVGRIEVNRIVPTRVRELYLVGMKEYCRLNYLQQKMELCGNFLKTNKESWENFQNFLKKFKPKIRVIKEENIEPLYLELKSFITALRKGYSVPIPGTEALNAFKIALSAIRSYRENRIIRV